MKTFQEWCNEKNKTQTFTDMKNKEICQIWAYELYDYITSIKDNENHKFELKLSEKEFVDRFTKIIYKYQE
jgi:hypothetical protein